MSSQKLKNPWNYKPWWCQPWSILLTGVAAVGGSWLLTNRIWVSVLVALPILAWWSYFLIIWPRLMANTISSPSPAVAPKPSIE